MADGPHHTVTLARGTVVSSVAATVTASATARMMPIAQVAQVTSDLGSLTDASTTVFLDFGSPQPVSALSLAIPWNSLKTADDPKNPKPLIDPTNTGNEHTTETFAVTTVTQRLQITFLKPVAPATVAVSGSVLIAVPPADLEILVNATRAWAWPGSADPAPSSDKFVATPDLTQPLQDEVNAGRSPVQVRLRSRTPGTLTLDLSGFVRQVYSVVFGDGPVRSIDAATEGDIKVDLPLPSGAAGWQISGVGATLVAQCGPERVPPGGDVTVSADAAIVVDPDRAVTVRLPLASTHQLAELAGIRIPVRVGPEGAELRGALRAGDGSDPEGGEPGPPLLRGDLVPAPLEPGSNLSWASLLLPKVQPLHGSGAVWVDIAATRGRVEWPLAVPSGAKTAIRRPNPGGGYRRLSQVAGIDTDAAAVRVVGVPPAQAPIFPADLAVEDPGGGIHAPQTVTQIPSDSTAAGASADFSIALGDSPRLGGVRLRLTARTAGTFTLSGVTVAYGSTGLPTS